MITGRSKRGEGGGQTKKSSRASPSCSFAVPLRLLPVPAHASPRSRRARAPGAHQRPGSDPHRVRPQAQRSPIAARLYSAAAKARPSTAVPGSRRLKRSAGQPTRRYFDSGVQWCQSCQPGLGVALWSVDDGWPGLPGPTRASLAARSHILPAYKCMRAQPHNCLLHPAICQLWAARMRCCHAKLRRRRAHNFQLGSALRVGVASAGASGVFVFPPDSPCRRVEDFIGAAAMEQGNHTYSPSPSPVPVEIQCDPPPQAHPSEVRPNHDMLPFAWRAHEKQPPPFAPTPRI